MPGLERDLTFLNEAIALKEQAIATFEKNQEKALNTIKAALDEIKKIQDKTKLSKDEIAAAEDCFKVAFELNARFYAADSLKYHQTISYLWMLFGTQFYIGLNSPEYVKAHIKVIEHIEQIPIEQRDDHVKLRLSRAFWNIYLKKKDSKKQIDLKERSELVKLTIHWLEQLVKPSPDNTNELIFSQLRLCQILDYPPDRVAACQKLLSAHPTFLQTSDCLEEFTKFQQGVQQKLVLIEKLQQQVKDLTTENSELKKAHDLLSHKKQKTVRFAGSVHSAFAPPSEITPSTELTQTANVAPQSEWRTTLTNNTN